MARLSTRLRSGGEGGTSGTRTVPTTAPFPLPPFHRPLPLPPSHRPFLPHPSTALFHTVEHGVPVLDKVPWPCKHKCKAVSGRERTPQACAGRAVSRAFLSHRRDRTGRAGRSRARPADEALLLDQPQPKLDLAFKHFLSANVAVDVCNTCG